MQVLLEVKSDTHKCRVHCAPQHRSAPSSAPGVPCGAVLLVAGLAAPDAAARLDAADTWPSMPPPAPPPPPPPQLRAGPLWQHVSSGLPLADAWFSVRASACDPNPTPSPARSTATMAPPARAAPGARGAPTPAETGVPAGSASGGLGATRPPSAHAEDSPLARGRSACTFQHHRNFCLRCLICQSQQVAE